ncbi:MAG: serine/threonine protein kinase, partial [Phycisphaerae bacterium]|nr:serine/threonine protein kinase [Phycisphaerae bacterium]
PVTSFANQQSLSIRARLELFVQACNAADHAHTKGVLHRDLKPSNVLASMRDGKPFVKVIDFGIAKATGAVGGMIAGTMLLTEDRQFIGTPEYMSPEQAMGLPDVGPRTDVYALGVILYELLAGVLPFSSDKLRSASYTDMQRAIVEVDPPTPSQRLAREPETLQSVASARGLTPVQLVAALRGELDWIVMKALEKSPDRRYSGAKDLADDVQRHLRGEAVRAAPPSTGYRMRKLVRRRKGLLTAGGMVALAVLVGLAATFWQASVAGTHAVDAASERKAKVREQRIAEARRLATLSVQAGPSAPNRRTLLAVAAVAATDHRQEGVLPECMQALIDAVAELGGTPVVGHDGAVTTATFSPDDTLLLTASRDQTARVWEVDAEGGVGLWHALIGHTGSVVDASFSPDGRAVLTASTDGTARVWTLRGAEPIGEPLVLKGHEGAVNGARFSRDGRSVLTWGQDGTARVWPIEDSNSIENSVVLVGHSDQVRSAAFSPDGSKVATASHDGTVRLWDLTADDPSGSSKVLARSDSWQRDVAFSDDGAMVGSAGLPSTVWNVTTAEPGPILITPATEAAAATRVAFSPNSRTVATSRVDGTVELYQLAAAQPAQSGWFLQGHTGEITSLQFSPDGLTLLSASRDNSARVRNFKVTSDAGVLVLNGHDSDVNSARFNSDATKVVTATERGTARIWDLTCANPNGSVLTIKGHSGKHMRDAAFGPDGRVLITVGDDGTAQAWNLSVPCPSSHPRTILSCGSDLRNTSASADGTRVTTAGTESCARVWAVRGTGPAREFASISDPDGRVWFAKISPDGHRVATVNNRQGIRIWTLGEDGQVLQGPLLSGHTAEVRALEFSSDGDRLVSAAADNTARVWSLSEPDPSATCRALKGHTEWVMHASFSPDGSRVVTASADRTARIWSLARADPSVDPIVIRGHRDWVRSAYFSRDGQSLLTASQDGTARVWSLREYPSLGTSIALRAGKGLDRAIWSPDCKRIATIAVPGAVQVWDLDPETLAATAKRVVGRDLSTDELNMAFPYA